MVIFIKQNFSWKYKNTQERLRFSIFDFWNFILGISLNPEQWSQLKEQISDIDDAVRKL